MDWDKQYGKSFDRDLKWFKWEHRAVRCYQITASAVGVDTNLQEHDFATDDELTKWLESEASKPLGSGWPKWSLTIIAAKRAYPSAFEKKLEASANSLLNMGFSKSNFLRIVDTFRLPRSLLHRISSDQSQYDRQHPEIDGIGFATASFNLRTSPLMLDDLALSLRSDSKRAATFVLLLGFTDADFKTLSSWLMLMKDDAGHPLLMIALFMDMHYRRLQRTYRDLRNQYVKHSFENFSHENVAEVLQANTKLDAFRTRIQLVMALYEALMSLEAEMIAFGMRVSSLTESIKYIAKEVKKDQYDLAYIREIGSRFEDRLHQLLQDGEYLKVKTSMAKESTSSLISAMWNSVALNGSQISQQISVASKRDSSIMMGITVGTLTFLPGTAIATIFAMPMFNWEAGPEEHVIDHRFWVYLAVALPITGVTLIFLFLWMFIIDIREQSPNLTMKESVRKRLDMAIRPFSTTRLPRRSAVAGKPSADPA